MTVNYHILKKAMVIIVMLFNIIIIIVGALIAVINTFLEDASKKSKRIKKITTILAALTIVLSSIMQLIVLSVDPPEIRFDTYGKRVRFESVQPAYVTYQTWHDFNEERKWVRYREDDIVLIDQVPTYLSYRSDLGFLHSATKEFTFLRDEDGGIQMISGIYNRTGSDTGVLDWEPDTSYGWGPERALYSMKNPAPEIVFNSLSDNGNIGNELYFVSASEYTGDAKKNHWSDYTYVKEDHEYVIRIYVHNNAASNLGLTARDVRAFITLPNEYARTISVGCVISCPDANPERIWDGTSFYSDDERPFALMYVEDSLKYYTNAGTFRLQDETKGDYLAFTNKGVLLGYDEMNGLIPGCMQYAGYLTFHVKPVFKN